MFVSWEWSYNTSKNVLYEEIHERKIFWKTSYFVTWRTSHCDSNVLKNDVRIGKLDTWKTRNDVIWNARNIVIWEIRNLVAWKTRNLYLIILIVFFIALIT